MSSICTTHSLGFHEPEAERLLVAIEGASSLSVGAPTLTEAGIVIGSRLGFGSRDLAQLLDHFEVNLVPFGHLHGEEALRAYEKFGDCLTYAVAKLAQERLLCVGQGFVHTDLPLVDY